MRLSVERVWSGSLKENRAVCKVVLKCVARRYGWVLEAEGEVVYDHADDRYHGTRMRSYRAICQRMVRVQGVERCIQLSEM